MKNVAVLQRSDNRLDPSRVYPLLDRLISLGCEIRIPASLDWFYSGYKGKITFVEYLDKENTEIIFVLGGDGSIISAARENISLDVPIVGINFGNLAYMAELEITELDLVDRIIAGEARIEERIMLDVTVIRGDTELKMKYPALNDVVLSNGPLPRVTYFDLVANGVTCQSYCSDGMVIATPTGSTAYSMSAGGPVVDPSLDCIIATPICPHSIGQRPVLFSSDTVLELTGMKCRSNNVYLSADGREVLTLEEGDLVRITKSGHKAKLAHVKNSPFLMVLNEKMGESEKKEKK